jgi:OmcA/MtrC family decaheme c-type cytochrome
MNRFEVFRRWAWSILVVSAMAFALGGCSGDDGQDGADGAPGPQGPTGPDGPAGPAGPGASITPLESCSVCHDDGSFASAPEAHAVYDIGSFADFAVTPDGADLVVSFSATADGEPATAATFRRAYFSTGTVRTSLSSEIEDNPDRFVNNGDGTYSVRIVDGVARFGGDNGRYLVVVLTGANALEIAAVGDYPSAIPLAGLASNEACQGCHGVSGEVGRFDPTNRGGHYSAPIAADQCVVCHRPDDPSTPDEDEEPSYMRLVRVVHGIHNSHNFPDGQFVSDRGITDPDRYPPYDVSYPTYMTNCSVCHSADTILPATGDSALAAANTMPVSAAGCFTCHGSMAGWNFEADPDTGKPDLTFHLNIVDPEAADCTVCHDGNTAPATVAGFHNGLTTGRGGIIFDGVDTAVAEGAKFDWQVTGVVDDGVNLAITWQASYDGVGVDPCNATVGAGAPVFFVDNRLRVYRNYAQGDDFILGQSTSAPGQALNVDVTVDNTVCAANVATTTIPVDTVDADKGRLALGGKPLVVSVLDPAETMQARVPTPTYDWIIGDGAAAVDRRSVVDTGECLKCHVGSLYQHGGDRVDNVDMCIVCHNSASNEKNVRVGMGVDASEAYDGKIGETFEMKTMLHQIHSAAVPGKPPYVIYRNRGIYAFANDESQLPNWPGTGQQEVFGSDGVVTNHNFHSADYPRALNACTACHVEGLPVQPDQAKAMAATVDAGSETWEDQLDDVLQGATTTACVTCHADSATKGHAYQNSWEPQEFDEGRQTIIDAVN